MLTDGRTDGRTDARTDGRTDDGRKVITIAHPEQSSGELISPAPLAAMFFDKSKWLEKSCNKITKGTFLQNHMEIGPVVSDKKIFKVFFTDIQ